MSCSRCWVYWLDLAGHLQFVDFTCQLAFQDQEGVFYGLVESASKMSLKRVTSTASISNQSDA